MFNLFRKQGGPRKGSSRQVARERVRSAIGRDRMEVSAQQLSALRDNMLFTIREHLPVAPDFTEFGLQRDGDGVFLVSRVRLDNRW